MLKVGLTGGYASGKTLVARHLASLGCHVIYADLLGHQVLAPEGEAYRPVLALFGPAILNTTGQSIDRKKLAAIVFADSALLQQLNHIVHPAVFRLEAELLTRLESQDPRGIAILEAAILIESGGYQALHKLIVTTCLPETQLARAIARDHITREEALQRIARQLPDAERIRHADYLIHTDGSPEETIAQTALIYAALRQLAEAPAH